jgi:HEPN domain-containing protein
MRRAAQGDFTVEKLLPDTSSPDAVIGFHAQQAIEKMLKAALSVTGVRYHRTHDLVELIDLLRDSGVDIPEEVEDARQLGPFAAEFRYDDLPDEAEEGFDRSWALDCVRRTKTWGRSMLGGRAGPA